jgi:uncharacterized protein
LESRPIQTTRNTLYLPNWDADGFKIAQVTDVHIDSPKSKSLARKAVELAVAAKPDVIFFTGDFSTTGAMPTQEEIPYAFEPLRDAGCPCFAIFGNHDSINQSRLRRLDPLVRRHTALKLLRNEVVDMDGVTIAGMDDALFGQHRPDVIVRDQASRSLIVLLHEPDFVTDMPSFSSLVLSGHSHGGEICLPGGIPVHTPAGAKKLTVGFYPDATVPTYVSRGIGKIGPCRVYCPPEVALFTVKKGDGPATIQCSA